jgi:predicted DNA-binding transcriptional regulator YafY
MIASRLLSILLTLQTRGRVTARELAEAFEVSIRTIYRDIDELSAAGVPVYAEKGRGGGFEVLGGYRTRLTGLDRNEAETLFLAGLPSAAAQLGLGEALAGMRLKLLAALPEPVRGDAERVGARFHLDPVGWFREPDDQPLLPELALAVWRGLRVRIRYDSWKEVVERDVTPLGVVLKAGAWYLVGAVGPDVRTYRVASILELRIEATAGDAPAGFDLAAWWSAFSEDYERRMLSETAHIRAQPEGLRRLARGSAAMARAVAAAGPADEAGWREAFIPVESQRQAVWELLPIGARVEVLGPPELRAAMAAEITRLGAIYTA